MIFNNKIIKEKIDCKLAELRIATDKLEKLQAEAEAEIAIIREKYSPQIDGVTGLIRKLSKQQKRMLIFSMGWIS